MTNSWSLLYEELNMSNETNGNALSWLSPNSDPDTLTFIDPGSSAPPVVFYGSGLPGGEFSDSITFESSSMDSEMGNDHIVFGEPWKETKKSVDLDSLAQKQWKYNENEILKELTEYITATYNQHYSSDQIQTLDLIESCGDGEAFCRSNILKYASRYDKKGTARRDILKIMHYAVLLMYFNDKNAKRETYPQ
jgi:hypothetical protein